MRVCWRLVEPAPLRLGWYHECLCEHLEAVSRAEVTRLAIAVPPGHSKSTICSVLWPAWHWLHAEGADERWITTSVDGTLATRDARRCRGLIASADFSARWGDLVRPAREDSLADSATEFYVSVPSVRDRPDGPRRASGRRFATAAGGRLVGWHADLHLGDDLVKLQDRGPAACMTARANWRALASRRRTGVSRPLRRVCLGQRVAELDVVGMCLEEGWDALVLPLEYDPQRYSLPAADPRAIRPPPARGDRRVEAGEVLCPELVGEDELAERKREPDFQTIDNQDPDDRGERPYTRAKFGKPYGRLPTTGFGVWSWDLRFSKRAGKELSFVAGQYWWCDGLDCYLAAVRGGQWGFKRTRAEILAPLGLVERDRRIVADGEVTCPGIVLIENKANGEAIEDDLSEHVPGIKMVSPRGGKEARAAATEPYLDRLHLPASAPWLPAWIAEVEAFPRRPDDHADALSQFVCWRFLDPAATRRDNMRRLAGRR